jgi:hypothetical protein
MSEKNWARTEVDEAGGNGSVFYVRPQQGRGSTVQRVHDTFAGGFPGTGLGITGAGMEGGPRMFADGTYEVRTFGPGGSAAVELVTDHCGWEIAREIPWVEWHANQA